MNTLISACGRAQRWDLSLQILNDSCDLGPSTYTYNSAIGACERSGQWRWAVELLMRVGLQADVITYSSAINACNVGSQWLASVQLFQQMSLEGVVPNVVSHSSALNALAIGSSWQGALHHLLDMRAPNLVTYNIVLRSLASGARWQPGAQSFDRRAPWGPAVGAATRQVSVVAPGGFGGRRLQAFASTCRRKPRILG